MARNTRTTSDMGQIADLDSLINYSAEQAANRTIGGKVDPRIAAMKAVSSTEIPYRVKNPNGGTMVIQKNVVIQPASYAVKVNNVPTGEVVFGIRITGLGGKNGSHFFSPSAFRALFTDEMIALADEFITANAPGAKGVTRSAPQPAATVSPEDALVG